MGTEVRYVEAVEDTSDGRVKQGQIYPVFVMDQTHVQVEVEDGVRLWYFNSRFKEVPGPEVSPLTTQIGGNHYTSLKIQPFEYMAANNIGYHEGTAIKYLTRWKTKGGVEDLKKAKHAIEWLIAYTEKEASSG